MKEKILKLKEKVLKTYPLKFRHTLKVMSKKFRKIDNFNLSSISRHTLKIMSTGSERTSKFDLFPQVPESCLGMNRFKSISQNPGEILRQFSSEMKMNLVHVWMFLKYPSKSPRIFL
jgi:hypothetical protein